MTRTEMVEVVKKMIANGETLHGLAREIAIEFQFEEMERNGN